LGGEISVESEPGRGSIFRFTVPDSVQHNSSNSISKKEIDENIPDLKGKTILVAEDDDSNYFLLEILLKKAKAAVIRASNGLEAYEIFKLNPDIHLVLMDIKMPVMDGFDALKQIKNLNSQIVIIAQTAHSYQDEIDRIKSSGFDDYILKPINAIKLYSFIKKYLA
jgi:CheY-like chemotaxis protein